MKLRKTILLAPVALGIAAVLSTASHAADGNGPDGGTGFGGGGGGSGSIGGADHADCPCPVPGCAPLLIRGDSGSVPSQESLALRERAPRITALSMAVEAEDLGRVALLLGDPEMTKEAIQDSVVVVSTSQVESSPRYEVRTLLEYATLRNNPALIDLLRSAGAR